MANRAQHGYTLFASAYFKISTCDRIAPGYEHGPHAGDYQILLYDKPWYRPSYYIGVLLACVYVDNVADPDQGNVRRIQSPLLLAGAWAGCLALLCATSMAGYFVYHEEFNGFSGEVRPSARLLPPAGGGGVLNHWSSPAQHRRDDMQRMLTMHCHGRRGGR